MDEKRNENPLFQDILIIFIKRKNSTEVQLLQNLQQLKMRVAERLQGILIIIIWMLLYLLDIE